MTTIGLLHPGNMGARVGAVLRAAGHDVAWVRAGRSADTVRRAQEAGLRPETTQTIARECRGRAVGLPTGERRRSGPRGQLGGI